MKSLRGLSAVLITAGLASWSHGATATCPEMQIQLVNSSTFSIVGGAISGYGNGSGNSTGWTIQTPGMSTTMTLGGFLPRKGSYQMVADIQWYQDNGEWKHAGYKKCVPSPVDLPHKGWCPNGDRASVNLIVTSDDGMPSCAMQPTGW